MKTKVVLEDVGAKENGAQMWVTQKYSPSGQRLNYGINVCELEDRVGEKGWNSNWLTELGFTKKTLLTSFPNHLLESAWIKFAFPYGLLPFHKEAKRNTIRVIGGASAKLPHCMNLMLAYPMENEMPFVHHTIEQWGCGYTNNDDKSLNERIWRHLVLKPKFKLM